MTSIPDDRPDADRGVDDRGVDDRATDAGWVFIGLDGEMSAANLDQGGRLIQAGAAAWCGTTGDEISVFSSLIRVDDMVWDDRAAQVHGITRDELADAPTAADVDERFRAWLLDNGAIDGQRVVIPVGLNVAAFDLPFFRHTLPASSALLARRSVDLNAVLYTYDGWEPNPRNTGTRSFAGWKRSMKTAANTELARRGFTVDEHDAGFDAAQALIGWEWLRRQPADVTRRLTQATDHLDRVDTLRAVLGAGLRTRLAGIADDDLTDIIAALPTGVLPRRWFATPHPSLGATPLQALCDGRVDDVRNAARHRR